MTVYPSVFQDQGRLEVDLISSNEVVSELPIELVLDIDKYGEIIGIEILNMKTIAGPDCLECIRDTAAVYSYDKDSDAFYLRLKESLSIDQIVVQGSLVVNKSGSVIGIRAQILTPFD